MPSKVLKERLVVAEKLPVAVECQHFQIILTESMVGEGHGGSYIISSPNSIGKCMVNQHR